MVELECEVLRALCQTYRTDAAMKAASEALREYSWRYWEHGVVFEALQKVRPTGAVPLREPLAAQATRMGFPDVDWALYLEGAHAAQSIDQLLESLKELAGL